MEACLRQTMWNSGHVIKTYREWNGLFQPETSGLHSYSLFVQESCWQYWPDTVGEVTEFGEYIIDLISEETLTGFTIRTLSVLNKKVG